MGAALDALDNYRDWWRALLRTPGFLREEAGIEKRARELLEVVRKKLGPAFVPEQTPVGVVLTGGAAKLSGMDEAAGKVFGVPGRLGEAPAWVSDDLRDPGFSTVLGLLYYGLDAQAERTSAARRSGGFFQNIKRLITSV